MKKFEEGYWSSRSAGAGARTVFGRAGGFLSSLLALIQLRSLLRTTRRYAASGCLLDAGCGLGQFLSAARITFDSYGLDVSRTAVELCKRRGLEVMLGSAEAPCFKDGSFDVVVSLDVLEHLILPSLAVKRLSSLLKPNGVLIVRTPNLSGVGARVLHKNWFGYLDATHVSLANREDWIRLLEDSGLTIEESFSDSLFFLILGESKIANRRVVLRYLPIFVIGLFSLLGFGLGIRYPPFGENLCVVARK